MSLNFPNRYVWLMLGIIMLLLLQSGCQPIPPPDSVQSSMVAPQVTEEEARPPSEIQMDSASPNHEWIATTLFERSESSDEYHQVFVVTHQSGAPSYILVDEMSHFGLGYTLPVPIFWSEDGHRLYFTNFPQTGGCAPLANGADLSRVELATGEVDEVLAPDNIAVVSISPDEQQVAYITWGEPTIFVRDLATEEESSVDLVPFMRVDGDAIQDAAGAIVWSPDSSELVFVVAHKPCMGGWAQATSIYVLDVATLEVVALGEDDAESWRPVAWPDEKTLLLEDPSGRRLEFEIPAK